MKSRMEAPQKKKKKKLKIELPYDPEIAFLNIYLKEYASGHKKRAGNVGQINCLEP
jgi:hypothetical protein